MSDLKVEQKQRLSREEVARLITALADGLGDGGKVTVPMGSSTLELSVAGDVDYEFEVTVDGNEIEIELELKWSTSERGSVGSVEEESEDDEGAADEGAASESAADEADEAEAEAEEDEAEDGDAEQIELEAGPEGPGSDEEAVAPDVPAAANGQDRGVPADRTPRPPRGRPSSSAATTRSTSNGVDTAAVRAWAAANGLSVSPRGRIKDKVLQAYRDAGN